MTTLYIKGTKKEANEVLALGGQVHGYAYTPFDCVAHNLRMCADGTVIKFWLKKMGGSPIAKSYGVWAAKKGRIK